MKKLDQLDFTSLTITRHFYRSPNCGLNLSDPTNIYSRPDGISISDALYFELHREQRLDTSLQQLLALMTPRFMGKEDHYIYREEAKEALASYVVSLTPDDCKNLKEIADKSLNKLEEFLLKLYRDILSKYTEYDIPVPNEILDTHRYLTQDGQWMLHWYEFNEEFVKNVNHLTKGDEIRQSIVNHAGDIASIKAILKIANKYQSQRDHMLRIYNNAPEYLENNEAAQRELHSGQTRQIRYLDAMIDEIYAKSTDQRETPYNRFQG